MSAAETPYRQPGVPLPVAFSLAFGPAVRRALPGLGAAIAPFVLVAFATNRHTFGFAAGCTAALAWALLLLRNPHRIEILSDRVRVRFWLGRDRELPGVELEVQDLPGEIYLVTHALTVAFDTSQLGEAQSAECTRALRQVARDFRRSSRAPDPPRAPSG